MSRLMFLRMRQLDARSGMSRRLRATFVAVDPQAWTRLRRALWRLAGLLGLATVVGLVLSFGPALLAALDRPAVHDAWRAGAWAALGTALGVIPLAWSRRPGPRLSAFALAFAAGLMAAASVTSLSLPAWAEARSLGFSPVGAGALLAAALALGALGLTVMRRSLPESWGGVDAGPTGQGLSRRSLLLIALAIVLHNLPEGWAIGVASAGAGAPATALTLGIAIQDFPEGLIVALALQAAGLGRVRAALGGVASGLVEPLAAVAGALMVEAVAGLLPWALGAAAGAMLKVVGGELMPVLRAHRPGRDVLLGALAGVLMMVALDHVIG